MSNSRTDLAVEVTGPEGWTLAATLHLPPPERLKPDAPVLVAMPGAGYNRRYFDLPEPGYSEAEHHVAQGIVVVALDHLSVGDSSIPPEPPSILTVAAANSAAVGEIVSRLKSGSLTGGRPIVPAAVAGAGQSMGGIVAVAMQARHRPFDGIAVLGASLVCTRLPSRSGEELRFAGDADPLASARQLYLSADWRYALHWEDVPEHLVAADMARMPPTFGDGAPWNSATAPDTTSLVLPGVLSREAAGVDVPVLLAMGERDVCQDPLRELAAFQSARDLAQFVVPKMAHMHNFAGTRALMWRRIDAFVAQVAALKASAQPPSQKERSEASLPFLDIL
jgi:pimeloyl-ACP methyl ester carboxylesterase